MKPRTHRLPLREINGNLTLNSRVATSWWKLPGVRWAFLSDAQRLTFTGQVENSWGSLAGATGMDRTHVHMRITTSPYDTYRWARDYDAEVNAHSTPPNPQAWSDHLAAGQQAMRGTVNLGDVEVYLGVDLAPRSMLRRARSRPAAKRALQAAVTKVDAAMTSPGMAATEATNIELQHLVHRSTALHMPVPGSTVGARVLRDDDLYTFTDGVEPQQTDSGLGTKITTRATRNGQPLTRYVAVLSVGISESLTTPGGHEPWIAYGRRLPFPIEWSAHLDVLTGPQARKIVQKRLDMINDQLRQIDKTGEDAGPELEILREAALRIRHRMDTGDPVASAEVVGPVRLAVSAADEDTLLERVLMVQQHYLAYRITIEHPRAQRALLDEFVPGAKVVTPAYTRHMPLDYFSRAVPNLDASIGTRTGAYLGYTVGASRRPVFHDSHQALFADNSGMCPVVGEPGAGKSFLIGLLTHEMVQRGIPTTVLDPAGTLSRLTLMPTMRGLSDHVDLLTAPAGTLNPYSLIPTPRREDHDSDSSYAEALAVAVSDRRLLAQDVLRMLLPPAFLKDSATDVVLADAFTAVHARAGTQPISLRAVVEQMRVNPEPAYTVHARAMAISLSEIADAPLARLLFAPSGDDSVIARAHARAPKLLVLSMAGLQLPDPKQDRSTWTLAERLAVPLLHLAAWLATARAFTGPRETPKGLALDEAHFLSQWAAGRALFTRVGRDSRKWRLRAYVATQLPGDVLGHEVGQLTKEMFVGRLEDPKVQQECLRMLRVPTGVGYEEIIGQLSASDPTGRRRPMREFIHRDARERVDRFAVTLDPVLQRDLLTALSTEMPIPAEWAAEQVPA